MPNMVSVSPPALLTAMLISGCIVRPARPALTVSREKVEKVVMAPKNPVISSSRISGFRKRPRSAREKSRPMRKQPARLTISVPQGKSAPQALAASTPALYLVAAPRLPPSMTSRRFFRVINVCMDPSIDSILLRRWKTVSRCHARINSGF